MENKKLALDKFIEGIMKIHIPINGKIQDNLFKLYYKCKDLEKKQLEKEFIRGFKSGKQSGKIIDNKNECS